MSATPAKHDVSTLETFLQTCNDLAHRANTGTYIYRGEHKKYDKVSSSLYRRYRKTDQEGLGTASIQEDMLKQGRAHAPEMSDVNMDEIILAQLRHNGGETNVIDFTKDYLVALFFASDGKPHQPGQIHFLPAIGEGYTTFEPLEPIHRVTAQKSVLVKPDQGFVHPAITVEIKAEQKPAVLEQLHAHHGISAETIYNDLYGLIQHQQVHRKAYNHLYQGVALSAKEEFQQAIEAYTKCIRRNPQMQLAYQKRADAYHELKDYDNAVSDYQKTLTFNTRDDQVHHNLGIIYLDQKRYADAIEALNQALHIQYDNYTHYYRFEAWLLSGDWEKAKIAALDANDPKLEITWQDIAEMMKEEYQGIADFEAQKGIRLPDDIAELLGGR